MILGTDRGSFCIRLHGMPRLVHHADSGALISRVGKFKRSTSNAASFASGQYSTIARIS
jgi:hypothetical protein